MRISIVLGRGIEGCGVTKNAVEWESWLTKNGHITTIYASKDKKWSRNNSHNIRNLVHVRFDKDDFEQVYEGCKKSDIVIFSSLPSVNHSQKCIKNFSKLFDLNVKKISFQHDHNKSSLRRNALIQESIEKVDMIFAHSTSGDFADMVNTPNLFDMTERKINLRQPAINFSEYKKYWKQIYKQDPRHHKWIGRTARWKGYDLMFNFHNNHLKNINHQTTFEGIEKSPVFIEFKRDYEFYDCLDSNPNDMNDRYGDKASVFSQYVNSELLERLSKCGFGYQLSILDKKYIEKSLEFTHLEIVAVGAIPIFRKEYGDICIHRYYNKPLTEIDSGTIWLSEDNMEDCKNKIIELSKDNELRDDYRKKAVEYYSYYDCDYVISDMFKIIKE